MNNFLLLIIWLLTSAVYATNSIPFLIEENDDELACYCDASFPNEITTKCLTAPKRREYPINNSINPCVNFYEYACSSVINNYKLPEDRSAYLFSAGDIREDLLEFKKKYFLNLAQKVPESQMEEEVKNYYLACMNEEARKKEEIALVAQTKKLLDKIKTKEEFINLIAENITNPSGLSFISFSTELPNLDRPNYNDLSFVVKLMGLPEKSYYENIESGKAYQKLIEQLFISIDEKLPKQKAEMVFSFEKELAHFYPNPQEEKENYHSRNETSREDLIKKYPYFKLEKFLTSIPKHVVIRNIIGNSAMEFLNKKLQTASLEELKSIYLYFQLAPILDDAYPDFSVKNFEFNKKYLGGPNKRSDRQKRCTKNTMYDFKKEVDFILLSKLFPNFPKEKFIKMIEKIRDALLDQLNKNSWLEESTKKEAIRKIKTMKLLLVSPNNEEEWDFNPITTYAIDTPIANYHKLAKLSSDKKLKKLSGPINTKLWNNGPLNPGASYWPSYNQFIIPIGLLQYPYYDPNEPDEVNLGAVGQVIAHEFSHALDNHGSLFNADGVINNWVSPKDKKIFDEKTKYLVTQFNNAGHNGEFSLGENIAELVGLTVAYKAAFPNPEDSNQELKKRFFLQYARMLCMIQKKEIKELALKTDPHVCGEASVNEQIKHQRGFKKAYNCSFNDPMVIPDNKIIELW